MEEIKAAKSKLIAGLTTSHRLTEESLARATDSAGQGKLVFTKLFPAQATLTADAVDKMIAAGVDLSPLAAPPSPETPLPAV